VDVNGNGTLEDGEVTNTAYACNEGAVGVKALARVDPEPAGAHCANGGSAVHIGLDTNGNGTLESEEVADTQYVCSSASFYATGWAASSPRAYHSGAIPPYLWYPVGRKVNILKTSATSRLKVTVSDNFNVGNGVNGGYGYYDVLMNGGAMLPTCQQVQYVWNSSGWTNSYYFPFATVCLSEQLPVGLYEFEVMVYANGGTAQVGAGLGQPLVFVEEIPETASHGFSSAGGIFSTTSTTFQKAPGREVVYTKQAASTLLKVTLADTLRVGLNQNGGYGTLMVRMDGVDTSCYTGKFDSQGTGGDFHNPLVMTCILPGVAVGQHTFNVWLRADSGGEAKLGWARSYPLLMVEEIANQNLTYSNSSVASGEISGNWVGVGARWVLHTVSTAGKTLRVTYSDTFRSTVGCNGWWGFYQLYVDNQPSGCSNAQHSYNVGAGQDHHHPVNHVCLVKGLSPGPHTFSIWTSTYSNASCGSNHFGWHRGQNLLLVEELP
jgi:hypothetical protein